MNNHPNCANQEIWDKLIHLKNSAEKARKAAVKNRINRQPHITDLEYLLGAFIEMYEPHLQEIIHTFSEKGYAIEPTSGFAGKNAEFQTMNGYFAIDYVTRNKLEKIDVKLREFNGTKSLIFWPSKASLDEIKAKWLQVVSTLPDRGVLAEPTNSFSAVKFRRKYVPKDPLLQEKRLFERLQYSIQKKIENDIKKRIVKKPHPDNLESRLGFFVEELQPQVRNAVLEMNIKGYSTDVSGFMDNPCHQMIEGDFQLEEKIQNAMQAIGATVETNPSGYTRIQFKAGEANIKKIKKKWDKIVSLLPKKNQAASPSMTRKAREFRTKN